MFDDPTSLAVRAALTGLVARQRVTADNIANIQTPGFTAGRVEFEGALRDAMSSGGDAAGVTPTTVRSDLAARQDGNNVNLDDETLSATRTNLSHQLLLRAMDDRFGQVSAVLKGVR